MVIQDPGDVYDMNCPGGYSQEQGALILRQPQRDSTYYVFHRRSKFDPAPGISIAAVDLLYSAVTLKKDRRHNVFRKGFPIVDTLLQGGHLSAMKHANGTDWWIIQPGRHDNYYYTILFTRKGIDTVFTQILNHPRLNDFGGGQTCFSPNGKMYARTDLALDGVFLLDFDRTSGRLYNYRNIFIDTSNVITGLAFSASSRFLYVTTLDRIFQYDLDAVNIEESQVLVAEWDGFSDPFPTSFYLCNLGPDCRIYINTSNGVQYMHVIEYPDRKGLACNVRQHAIKLPTHNAASMPNFPHFRVDEEWPCDSTIGLRLTPVIDLPEGTITFEIYPNPADDVLYLDFELDKVRSLEYEMTDLFGRSVYRTTLKNNDYREELSVSHLPPGVYTWQLHNDQGSHSTGKVVIR